MQLMIKTVSNAVFYFAYQYCVIEASFPKLNVHISELIYYNGFGVL